MSAIEGAAAAPGFVLDQLSLRLAASPSFLGASKGIVLLSIASTAVVFLAGISLATVGEASALGVFVQRPLATVQTAAGLSLWTGLIAVPAARLMARLWSRREVRIEDSEVQILRHTPFGISRQSVSLSTYRGLAHHIRASLSGLTHEIVLVHPNQHLSVTLLCTEHVTQARFEELKALLGLPEIPASAIYERGSRRAPAEPATTFSAAAA
ncbi:MAG: hypothetical protein AB7L90_00655 [Hyphomicrobiaceae bacterium]